MSVAAANAGQLLLVGSYDGPKMRDNREVRDVFVSYASEDKDDVARPVAQELRNRGLDVWYDEFSLVVGDSLRREIERGLTVSKFGVVVLSEHFFRKEWPQRELDALTARETGGTRGIILPVWVDGVPVEVEKALALF
jgi:hypothetical protein